MVHAKRVRAGERHGDTVVDQEWERSAKARYHELILARGREAAEVSLQHLLVGSRRIGEPGLAPNGQRAGVNRDAGRGGDELEARRRGDIELAQIADVVT